MTCQKYQKVGYLETFWETEKVSNTNFQDAETHATNEEAVLELMVADQDGAREDYYAYLFMIEEQEHMSASFHTKDASTADESPRSGSFSTVNP
jgi:hypothetical protein